MSRRRFAVSQESVGQLRGISLGIETDFSESILIEGDHMKQILEYETDKLVIRYSTLFLLLDNWHVTHSIDGQILEFKTLNAMS